MATTITKTTSKKSTVAAAAPKAMPKPAMKRQAMPKVRTEAEQRRTKARALMALPASQQANRTPALLKLLTRPSGATVSEINRLLQKDGKHLRSRHSYYEDLAARYGFKLEQGWTDKSETEWSYKFV
jgi:hypothetical protein